MCTYETNLKYVHIDIDMYLLNEHILIEHINNKHINTY